MSVPESGVAEAPRPRRGRPPSVGLAERRREQLTDAAFTVFAGQGYEQASVADIARRAGMGQGTLYRYVEGKRELLDLVFDRCVDELATAIAPDSVVDAAGSGDLAGTEQMVENVAARLFALADSRPDILKVVMVQSGTVDEELRFRIQGLYRTFDSMMGRALGHARERGWIVTRTERPEEEAVQLGRLLPALGVPGLVMGLTGGDDPERRQSYVRAAVRMSASGVLSDGARAALPDFAPAHEEIPDPAAAPAPAAGRSGELLDAAIAEFVEKGYAAVGVREITERAGVSHGTFYNYFDSKRHMLAVLLERNREAILGRLDAAVAALPAEVSAAELRAAIQSLNTDVLRDIADRREEFRFLVLEVPGVDVEAIETYLGVYYEATARFAVILGNARDAGLLDESFDSGDIAQVWMGYLLGTLAAMVNDVDVTNPAESARVITNLLLGGARTP
ncbi:TetR/AcrR family transcriptional regulator [Tsukamurella asaccharolytica]|uniref:TetR/AcrR family transcriptional regulator n=1 Tax=Tsukamurella asaccharolytica TaxID=2592067 RepID=A0A5C5RGN3_9ACTN|nr:TetR/AcrR family transcriptional regulator [Tsukamurella asaccharolytica]TWS21215.1 TetR/AcrR family transcriptional regulator [Tsukamurella asaccharolytica]